MTIAAIECGEPLLIGAREVIAAFPTMIRMKSITDLDPLLKKARTGPVTSFANINGVIKDRAAVNAAITTPSDSSLSANVFRIQCFLEKLKGNSRSTEHRML